MEKISVVVPVYNAASFINTCINSILNQSYRYFELLLINDGSKDESFKIIKEAEKKDSRIKVYTQENYGASATRNRGIEIASGSYITFIDSDDFVDKNYLEVLYENIKDNDVVISGYKKVDMNNHDIMYSAIPNDTIWNELKFVSTAAKLYKLSYLKSRKINFYKVSIGEDVYFNILCNSMSNKIISVPYAGYNYCLNKNSVTQNLTEIKINRKNEVLGLVKEIYYSIDLSKYSDEMVSFFCIKTIVQHLLMMTRYASQKEVIDDYLEGFAFLKENGLYNKWWLRYEDIKINLCVFLFALAYRFHFINILVFFLRRIKLQIG